MANLCQINEAIARTELSHKEVPSDDQDPPSGGNQGKLIVDATCAPADIRTLPM